MPIWGSLYFQNSASPMMNQLIFFHDHTMFIMIMIMILVGYILFYSCFMSMSYNLGLFEGQELESIWTVLPGVFLLMLAFPSIRLLYLMEEYEYSEITVKIMGHQWFWSYEYSDFGFESYDSYMTSENSLFRLLDVDNCLVLPYNIDVRMIVSSYDVIHSWTLPSVGVKVDAIPGRLNQLSFIFNRVGLFIGQCSEICGANHSFMPIMISVIPSMSFLAMINL